MRGYGTRECDEFKWLPAKRIGVAFRCICVYHDELTKGLRQARPGLCQWITVVYGWVGVFRGST